MLKLREELKIKDQQIAEREQSEKVLALMNRKLQEDLKFYKSENDNTFEATSTNGLLKLYI